MTIVATYAEFAAREAHGVSPVCERLALAVSRDDEVLALLGTLPRGKWQLNLLFSVVRFLGGKVEEPATFHDYVTASWPVVELALRIPSMHTRDVHTKYVASTELRRPMSIRHGLLALLEHGPMYGYQLRASFQQVTAATWPLNIGQVYTTLSRLERDALVEGLAASESGQRPYALTDAGRRELAEWFGAPVSPGDRPRDELAIKLALAVTTPGVDVRAVVQSQRTQTVRTLQELTRRKVTGGDGGLAGALILDALIFQSEAEIRWLDHCELSLAERPLATTTTTTPAPAPAQRLTVPAPTPAPTEEIAK